MKLYTTFLPGKTGSTCLAIAACLILPGCAGTMKNVPEANRISLAATGEESGNFQFDGLGVTYSHTRKGDNLSLSGTVEYRWDFDSLAVYVLFLDTSGTVSSKKNIYFSGYRTTDTGVKAERKFLVNLPIPPGTVAISFNYLAQARNSRWN